MSFLVVSYFDDDQVWIDVQIEVVWVEVYGGGVVWFEYVDVGGIGFGQCLVFYVVIVVFVDQVIGM